MFRWRVLIRTSCASHVLLESAYIQTSCASHVSSERECLYGVLMMEFSTCFVGECIKIISPIFAHRTLCCLSVGCVIVAYTYMRYMFDNHLHICSSHSCIVLHVKRVASRTISYDFVTSL